MTVENQKEKKWTILINYKGIRRSQLMQIVCYQIFVLLIAFLQEKLCIFNFTRILYLLYGACNNQGADSGFEIGGWYDFHSSCRRVWGHVPPEKFDFAPIKMAIWYIWELLLLYQLLNYIYKLHKLCILLPANHEVIRRFHCW